MAAPSPNHTSSVNHNIMLPDKFKEKSKDLDRLSWTILKVNAHPPPPPPPPHTQPQVHFLKVERKVT